MMVNPFSFILVIIIGYAVARSRTKQQLFVTLLGVTMAIQVNAVSGYFLKAGGKEVDYSDVLLLFTAIVGLWANYPLSVKRKQTTHAVILLAWVLLGGVVTTIYPPTSTVISPSVGWDAYLYGRVSRTIPVIDMSFVLAFVKLGLFVLLALLAKTLTQGDVIKVYNKVIGFTKVHIVYVLLEVFTKYIFQSNIMTDIRSIIFGVGISTETSLALRGGGYGIYGITREASHLAEVMFLFMLLIILAKRLKENKVWVVCTVCIMALSMSFSVLMYMGVLAVVYFVFYDKKLNKKVLIALPVAAGVIIAGIVYVLNNPYYLGRITGLIEDIAYILSGQTITLGGITSSKVRMYGVIETFKVFLERPLLGVGLNAAFCNGGVVMALSNIGIVGFLTWLQFIKQIGPKDGRWFSKSNLTLLAAIILPNLLKGGVSMLYATYVILAVFLISFRPGIKQDESALR